MDHLLALGLATFALVAGFAWWNFMSAKRRKETGGNTSGIGGRNDPMA